MKIVTIVTTAMLGSLIAVPGLAQSCTKVAYADLDTTSPRGKAALVRRIATAASMTCDVSLGTTDLASHIAARDCRAHAIETAMQAVAAKTTLQIASR